VDIDQCSLYVPYMSTPKGRGAPTVATHTRFRAPVRQADADWLDAQEEIDGGVPPVTTSVAVVHPRTMQCQSEPALTHSNADDFFDQNCAGAVTKVSLWSLLNAYATIEPYTKLAPHRFSFFPIGCSPSLGVKLFAAVPDTFDRGSILKGNEPAIFNTTAVKPAVLEVRKPIANQQLPLTISYVLMINAGLGLRSRGCNQEREDGQHAYSLSEPSKVATGFAW